MKRCSSCEHVLPLDRFHLDKGKKDGRSSRCRRCAIRIAREHQSAHADERAEYMQGYRRKNRSRYNALLREWRAKNPGRDKVIASRARHNYRLRIYGLTNDQFLELLSSQSGACGICGSVFGAGDIVIDHDHRTGAARGLLCQRCNRGLGCFRDDATIMSTAADYVRAGGTIPLSLSIQAKPIRPLSPSGLDAES
jgi:hypothetical protein